MKVTTPKEMEGDLSQLEQAIADFEEVFKDEEKGLNYYHLVINGELNKETTQKVKEIYEKAGWIVKACKTSSENGERAGLTGLQLEKKQN